MHITSNTTNNKTELENIDESISTIERNIKRKRTLIKAYRESKPMGFFKKATTLQGQIDIYQSALGHLKQDRSRILNEAKINQLPPEDRSILSSTDRPMSPDPIAMAMFPMGNPGSSNMHPGSVFNNRNQGA